MSSFYGGKTGRSFIISGKFASKQDMINAFKQGPVYQDIRFNEYVIINAENKNDKDNGAIYMRGYDYTSNEGGAEYIGTVVGPSGPAPMFHLDSYNNVEEMEDFGGLIPERTQGKYQPMVDLLPGAKYKEDYFVDESGKAHLEVESFQDSIDWVCCSVRDSNNEESLAYVGFKLVYPIVEYEAESVDPYYNRGDILAGKGETNSFNNINLITRQDDGSHPFYSKWDLKIPKGIKGDSIRNIRVVLADRTIKEFVLDSQNQLQYDASGQVITQTWLDGSGIGKEGQPILVCDHYAFDKTKNGSFIYSIFLGGYLMLNDFNFDSDTGALNISFYQNGLPKINSVLNYIKSISIDSNSHLKIEHSDPNKGTQDLGNIRLYTTDESEFINMPVGSIFLNLEEDEGIENEG